LDEPTAQKVIDRCAEEAKIVAVEQEAKKKAEAAEKAAITAALGGLGGPINPTDEPNSRGVDAVAFANPLLPQGGGAGETAETSDESSAATLPGTMEATEGLAPEIGTHNEKTLAGEELSPEEQAVQVPGSNNEHPPATIEEEDDTAALAEGRVEPPAQSRNEP
jgi:hypothetical protein